MTGQQCWGEPSWPLGLSPLFLHVEKLRCRKPSHLAGAPSSSVTAEGRDPGLPASPSHTTSYSMPPLPPPGTPSLSRPSLQAAWALQQTTRPSSEWRLGKLGKARRKAGGGLGNILLLLSACAEFTQNPSRKKACSYFVTWVWSHPCR